MYERAEKVLPLGVSSNFRTYEPYPIYIERAQGSKMWDVDGREYTDFSMTFGALMVGHAHPVMVEALAKAAGEGTLYGMPHDRELRAAELICERFGLEQMRFTNSGSESTMHALRLARAYTGRDKVLKFEGAYHGGHDTVLVSVKPPRPRSATPGTPSRCPWATASPTARSRTRWSRSGTTSRACASSCERHENEVAAAHPRAGDDERGRDARPATASSQELRALCDEFGCLLIFDEVKTGAKLAWGGAQEWFKVKADIVCLAKAIGGGLPLGAFGARREIMDEIAQLPLLPRGHLREQPARHHRLHDRAREGPRPGGVFPKARGPRRRPRGGPQQDHQEVRPARGAR